MHGLLCSPRLVRFIYARMWGCSVVPALCLLRSPPLQVRPSWFICPNVWLQGLLVLRLPALSSHTPPVSVWPRPRESSPPWCQSPPLLLVWMNVYFVFPWCWTPLPFDFLSVLVVRGGAVCLPTLPSWFSIPKTSHHLQGTVLLGVGNVSQPLLGKASGD